MWSFKPYENNTFNKNVIINNLKYIGNYNVITPKILKLLLKNDIFPDLFELYNLIPNWVIKADLGRLLIIYFNGGIYCDIDCFIKKSFNSYNNNIILFTEKICESVSKLGPRESKSPENVLRIANFCFASKSIKHPFLKEVIDECLQRLKQVLINEKKTTLNDRDILWCCGPDVITTIYHLMKHKYNDLYLCDSSFLDHKSYGGWR